MSVQPESVVYKRCDAHAHFFMPGFVAGLPESCRRVEPDEVTLYAAYAKQHNVKSVLAVGYEGHAWAAGNNAYIAGLSRAHPWIWPVAFIGQPTTLTTEQLAELAGRGFVGLSLYLFDGLEAQLEQMTGDVWRWLTDHSWLLSVNASGDAWKAWQPILARFPSLHLIPAHLGLPPAHASAPATIEVQELLSPLTDLAIYPGVHVKLSGLYALAEPAHAYPHSAAWPYVAAMIDAFGTDRLLWGSDFSPALEHVTFAQTVDVVTQLPGLSAEERRAIWGGNLRRLLATHVERKEGQ